MKQCVANFSAFMELIKNFERTQLALTPWHAQLQTLFHFQFHVQIQVHAHWLIQII